MQSYRPEIYRAIDAIPTPIRDALRALAGGDAPWPLTILGSVGIGKTCAMLLLLDHVVGGLFWTFRDFCEEMILASQGRFYTLNGENRVFPGQMWRDVMHAPLVCLDEVGSRGQASDFQRETLQRVLDVRETRPLVLASNHSMETLEQCFDERVTSRMLPGTVVQVQGQDRRARR